MPTVTKMQPLLTPSEVAETLRVEPSTVYKWLKNGTLPSVRLGGTVRVPAHAIEDLLQTTTQSEER